MVKFDESFNVPEKRRRSPQEKKELSLKKDRRNDYGENSKSSRKNIPKNKALANRKIRHATNQALTSLGADEAEVVRIVEEKKKWKKSPDAPLKDYLENKR